MDFVIFHFNIFQRNNKHKGRIRDILHVKGASEPFTHGIT